ncbi:MAG: hypothetical protein Q9191_007444 [Dirinaria sp. TL-2023a]
MSSKEKMGSSEHNPDATLEMLPSDIKVALLSLLASVASPSLRTLVRASPSFHATYVAYRQRFLLTKVVASLAKRGAFLPKVPKCVTPGTFYLDEDTDPKLRAILEEYFDHILNGRVPTLSVPQILRLAKWGHVNGNWDSEAQDGIRIFTTFKPKGQIGPFRMLQLLPGAEYSEKARAVFRDVMGWEP